MKKILAMVLAILFLFTAAAACSNPEEPVNPGKDPTDDPVVDPTDDPDVPHGEPAEEIVFGDNDIYVAPDGNDSNSGTKDSPLASFAAAKEKAKTVSGDEKITVWFRGGTYYLDETVIFNETDRQNVVYRSYPDEEAVISGGKEITGWQTTEINGVTAWVADVPVGEDFMSLYGKNGHLSTTFYPEGTYLNGDPVSNSDYTKAYYQLDTSDMPEFIADEGVFIRVLNDPWAEQINRVLSVDFTTGILTFDVGGTTMHYNGNGYRYRFENIKSMLKNPGQWYLDVAESKVYYVPQSGETIDGFTLVYGNLMKLVDASNIDNLVFAELTFSDSRRNRVGLHVGQGCNQLNPAVSFVQSNNIKFNACTIKNTGFNGLYFGPYCRDCIVSNCHFDSIGGTACNVTHSTVTYSEDMTGNFTFTNNLVERFSRVYQHGEGLLIGHCDGADVSYNTIHDGYYTGISCGWVWGLGESPTNNIKVTHNLIYDIGQGCLSDLGGIYMLGQQPGSCLLYNTIYNISHCLFPKSGWNGEGSGGYGGNGIFLDEGSSYMDVKYNLVYNTTGGAVAKNQEGVDLIVANNIFAFVGDFPGIMETTYKNVYLNNDPDISFGFTSQKIIAIGNFNYCYDFSGTYRDAFEFDDNFDVDPGFTDALNYDFTLKDDAALRDFEGFEIWNVNDVGCNFD